MNKLGSVPSPVTDGGGGSAADGGGLQSSTSPVADGGGAREAGGGSSSRAYHKPLIASDLTTSRSISLRTEASPPERILWRHLRGKQLAGLKFRRQHPIGPYIADFCCVELSLVVEIDGSLHVRDRARADAERDRWLAERGFRIVRFTARAVFSNAADVVRRIEEEAARQRLKTPSVRCADTSPVGDGGGH